MARRSLNPERHRSGGAYSAGGMAGGDLQLELTRLNDLDNDSLQQRWRALAGGTAPQHLPRWLMERLLAYRLQVQALGDLDTASTRLLYRVMRDGEGGEDAGNDRDGRSSGSVPSLASLGLKDPRAGALKPGSVLVREHNGQLHHVMVLKDGFSWNGTAYTSLSQLAFAMTGTRWNGHRFFGLDRQSGLTARQSRRSNAEPAGTSSREPNAPMAEDASLIVKGLHP